MLKPWKLHPGSSAHSPSTPSVRGLGLKLLSSVHVHPPCVQEATGLPLGRCLMMGLPPPKPCHSLSGEMDWAGSQCSPFHSPATPPADNMGCSGYEGSLLHTPSFHLVEGCSPGNFTGHILWNISCLDLFSAARQIIHLPETVHSFKFSTTPPGPISYPQKF